MTLSSKTKKATLLVTGLARQVPGLLRRSRFPRSAEYWLAGFSTHAVSNQAYDELMRYLVTSWATYRNASSSGANFPGFPSWSGPDCDTLEGFSRIMPLFGAWCASGRPSEITLPSGKGLSLPEEFRRGLLAGTDPDASTWWGGMPGKSNQRIVEAADIALALWLFRDSVWSSMDSAERDRVIKWLTLVNGRPGLDNNWHLFFVLIDRVLAALDYPGCISGTREHFERIKMFYLGDGWFKDGPGGNVDFYNAWGFHYNLSWINRIDPEWDPDFIDQVQRDFLQSYQLLIAPDGLPILGRSVPYRLAAAAPLVAGAESHPGTVSPGLARRALNVTWHHFLSHGALRYGIVSQGYHRTNPRLVDPYAGPASSLWSLRSLVMAFVYPQSHDFWNCAEEPLPVERGDFDVTLPGARWRIRGEQSTGVITVEILDNPPGAAPGLAPFGRFQQWCNLAFGEPLRPNSMKAKYGRRVYRSDCPFFEEFRS